MTEFINPLAGIEYEQAWGPWGGTHRRGQNWQSGSAWDLLTAAEQMPVRAPFAGIVVSTGQGGVGRFAGARVGIQGEEMSCFLTHMSALTVSQWGHIDAGDVIGTTGQANGVWHLHVALGGPNYWDGADANGIDPRPFLEGSATLVAARGPKGFPLWRGDVAASTIERPEPVELPHGNTLRLMVQGNVKAPWAGWEECAGPLRWIAANGLNTDVTDPTGPRHWITWRGASWFGAKDVTNVCKHLVTKYLIKETP